MFKLIILILTVQNTCMALDPETMSFVSDYFKYKDIRYLTYFSCENQRDNKKLVETFNKQNVLVAVSNIAGGLEWDLERLLREGTVPTAVLLCGGCPYSQALLDQASKHKKFKYLHFWLVTLDATARDVTDYIQETFADIDLSVDTELTVATRSENSYKLMDVFNFGRIQGNNLEINPLGIWSRQNGLNITLTGFKYYHRWDFHNLTMRAITVIVEQPEVFSEEMLTTMRLTRGVSAMTKIAAALLIMLQEQHNFRFNYTIAGRWIGEPERNSTLAVTNALLWGEQDISATSARMFPKWFQWVDIFFPPSTHLQTKFYYLIPDKGVGDYENRFLTPMSPGVWWSASAVGVFCIVVLALAAFLENRPKPGLYAFFSVIAAACQQAYDEGTQILDEAFSSQGRKLTLLTVGLTSMLLYNFYTSSVVSWLLSAASPTVAGLDGLINSDLELVFEDIGYTRGWLDNPGFFYFSGHKNPKEDELREKKVKKAKKTTPLLLPVEKGIELVRTGGYAYHAEPYAASPVISRSFTEEELCKLGALQMMRPSATFIYAPKRSPYKQFIVWSMMRLLERGHVRLARERYEGREPACSGRVPRALALGQAAPAFLLLVEALFLALAILSLEILMHR